MWLECTASVGVKRPFFFFNTLLWLNMIFMNWLQKLGLVQSLERTLITRVITQSVCGAAWLSGSAWGRRCEAWDSTALERPSFLTHTWTLPDPGETRSWFRLSLTQEAERGLRSPTLLHCPTLSPNPFSFSPTIASTHGRIWLLSLSPGLLYSLSFTSSAP